MTSEQIARRMRAEIKEKEHELRRLRLAELALRGKQRLPRIDMSKETQT